MNKQSMSMVNTALWLAENKALNIKIINIETEEDKSSSSIMRMGRSFQGIRVWYTTGI